MSLPATPSSRYSTPSRHHHETTPAPSPSLSANAASTGPLFPSRRRLNEDATPSMYHESPSSSTLRVGCRNPCMVVEAVSLQLLLQPKPSSPLCGLTGASPSPGAKSLVAAPVYPEATGPLSPSTTCAGENPVVLPSLLVHHPPCGVTPPSPRTSTPLLQPVVPPLPRHHRPSGAPAFQPVACFGPPCVPA
jgi:hypothetical protein